MSCVSCAHDKPEPVTRIEWNIDNLSSIGGQRTTIVGAPRAVDRAVEFDGNQDALLVDVHPLAGAARFSAEVIFRPDPGGSEEQRFLHLQESASSDRVLFETRLTDDGRWFLDTYIKTDGQGHTLYAHEFTHPLGAWYHAALVVDGETMRHYVNGELELSRKIEFRPPGPGRTSIGARINEVHWFRGAIRQARFTTGVLSPDEFLSP
jgi:hypothetical protein